MDRSVLVLLVLALSSSASSSSCLDEKGEKFPDCWSCLVHGGQTCGWCLEQASPPSLARGCLPRASTFDCNAWYEEKEGKSTLKNSADDSIKPQKMEIKLRPNNETPIPFKAKKKENPVDMYFLLDLTGSMGPIKTKLESITDELMEVCKDFGKLYIITNFFCPGT